VLGGSAYRRDRDAEFARRDVPRATLLAEIDAAAAAVERVLAPSPGPTAADAPPDPLAQPYPERVANRVVTTGAFLVHLAAHLAYHLGQLDYHRRVVTGMPQGVGALPPAALPAHPATVPPSPTAAA
jgi:hypothetical protein